MIGDFPGREDLTRSGLPVSEYEFLLDRIGAAALPLTGAAACLIDLPPDVMGPRSLRMAAPQQGPLADALRSLAETLPREVDGAAARLATTREVAGRLYRFHAEDIGGGDRPLGVIVLCYEAAQCDDCPEFRMAQHFISMLEALLAERRAKQAMAQDMVVLGRHAAQLQWKMGQDPLTGLENAGKIKDHVKAALENGCQPHALVLIDVDHFKQINDLHGHQFGDVYLRAVAGALRGSLPDDARIGRIGGDEFAVLLRLPMEAEPALLQHMSRCRMALARLAESMGKVELGSVSMGAALYPRHGDCYDSLFEMADTALYSAKDAGRGAEVIFDPNKHLRFSLRELMRNFSGALAEGEIRPVFHPVVDLATGRCTGFEVLARWQGAAGEVMGPEFFHPIFENAMLAEQLTRSMIVQATEALSLLERRFGLDGTPLRIGINVTAFDLRNRGFSAELEARLTELGLPCSSMVIEVPETVMLGETGGRMFKALRELRSRGAKIALDDFGTGYGSLRHLGDWPIDMLKIDRQFVQGLSARPRDRAVVEAILGMARRFGFRVVAEGIETPGQLSYLRAMGCDAGQGHLLSPPISVEALGQAPLIYPILGQARAAGTVQDS